MWIYVNYENRDQAKWNNCRWDANKKRWYVNLKYTNAKDFQNIIKNKHLIKVKKYHVGLMKNLHKGYLDVDSRNGHMIEPYTKDELNAMLEKITTVEIKKLEKEQLEPDFID